MGTFFLGCIIWEEVSGDDLGLTIFAGQTHSCGAHICGHTVCSWGSWVGRFVPAWATPIGGKITLAVVLGMVLLLCRQDTHGLAVPIGSLGQQVLVRALGLVELVMLNLECCGIS